MIYDIYVCPQNMLGKEEVCNFNFEQLFGGDICWFLKGVVYLRIWH